MSVATVETTRAGRLRGTLGYVWTILGPFLGLILISALFAGLTRETGTFLSVDNWRLIAVQTVVVGIAALGMDGLEPVIITHPLSSLTDAEIDGRVRQVVEQARKIWLGR